MTRCWRRDQAHAGQALRLLPQADGISIAATGPPGTGASHPCRSSAAAWTRRSARGRSRKGRSPSRGRKRVPLRKIALKTKHSPLIAKVGGSQLKIATSAKLSSKREGFGTFSAAKALKLTAKVATRLNKKLRPKVPFTQGQPLGTLTANAQPRLVAILARAGRPSPSTPPSSPSWKPSSSRSTRSSPPNTWAHLHLPACPRRAARSPQEPKGRCARAVRSNCCSSAPARSSGTNSGSTWPQATALKSTSSPPLPSPAKLGASASSTSAPRRSPPRTPVARTISVAGAPLALRRRHRRPLQRGLRPGQRDFKRAKRWGPCRLRRRRSSGLRRVSSWSGPPPPVRRLGSCAHRVSMSAVGNGRPPVSAEVGYERLFITIVSACEAGASFAEKVAVALRATLALFAAAPELASLLAVRPCGAGEEAIRRYQREQKRYGALLRHAAKSDPAAFEHPDFFEPALIGGIAWQITLSRPRRPGRAVGGPAAGPFGVHPRLLLRAPRGASHLPRGKSKAAMRPLAAKKAAVESVDWPAQPPPVTWRFAPSSRT